MIIWQAALVNTMITDKLMMLKIIIWMIWQAALMNDTDIRK